MQMSVEQVESYARNVEQPWGQLFYQAVWHQLDVAFPDVSGWSVLDVGSGFGLTAQHFARRGAQVTALEPSPLMRERAADGYQLLPGGVEDVENLPRAAFDLAICHNVLDYVADPCAAVQSIALRVKSGGYLSLVSHNATGHVMQRAVFDMKPAEALDMLTAKSFSVSIGQARIVSPENISDCLPAFAKIKEMGVRVCYALSQDNERKRDPEWQTAMLALEVALGNRSPYREMAFYWHGLWQNIIRAQAQP